MSAPTENPVVNRRRLLKAGLAASSLPLWSFAGALRAAAAPRGLHLSFTDAVASTRTITWFTDGLDEVEGVVEYGPVTPEMSEADIAGAPFPFAVAAQREKTFGVGAQTHWATMTAIDTQLPLRYRVGSAAAWSEVQVCAPPRSVDEAFSFCHYGDHGMTAASRAVRDAVIGKAPDFVVIAGDLSYANGDQPLWDAWFEQMQPLAARVPLMTAPGNHEEEDNGGQAYRSRFRQPGHNVRYAWDYRNAHFLFSTGGSLVGGMTPGLNADLIRELYDMEHDLADAAARRARGEIDFIIVVQHFTVWTDEDGRDPAALQLVLLEEDMLLRYGVDLLLVGHDHIYQRSRPMAYGRPADYGYVQITQGGGGQSLYELTDPLSDWSAFATLRYGFSRYKVSGNKIHIGAWAVDEDDNSIGDGQPRKIDEYALYAKTAEQRQRYVHPPRKDWIDEAEAQRLIANTVQRNARHHHRGA